MEDEVNPRPLQCTKTIMLCLSKIRSAAAKEGLLFPLTSMIGVVAPLLSDSPVFRQLQAQDILRTSFLPSISSSVLPFWRQEMCTAEARSVNRSGEPGAPSIQGTEQMASEVLDLLEQYGRHMTGSSDPRHSGWSGRASFSERVKDQVRQNTPIKMVLPSFPWKSVSGPSKSGRSYC